MARTEKKEQEQREKFLAALKAGASVSKAATDAGIPRRTAYNWRDADKTFAESWDDAIEEGTDRLEDEGVKRGLATSDTMLIFMLKARRPEKFKDRAHVDIDLAVGRGSRMEAALKRLKSKA